jgi:hypothetical protein
MKLNTNSKGKATGRIGRLLLVATAIVGLLGSTQNAAAQDRKSASASLHISVTVMPVLQALANDHQMHSQMRDEHSISFALESNKTALHQTYATQNLQISGATSPAVLTTQIIVAD